MSMKVLNKAYHPIYYLLAHKITKHLFLTGWPGFLLKSLFSLVSIETVTK